MQIACIANHSYSSVDLTFRDPPQYFQGTEITAAGTIVTFGRVVQLPLITGTVVNAAI